MRDRLWLRTCSEKFLEHNGCDGVDCIKDHHPSVEEPCPRTRTSQPPPEPGTTDPSEGSGSSRPRAIYRFEDIFSLPDIQRIQDAFATAAGVAAIITDPKGHPLTRPSNFTTLCATVIRVTPKGLAQCRLSDASLGQLQLDGPSVRPCQGCGLLDGGTAIRVGGHHVATWLIGQVLDAETDPESLLGYATAIGADPDAFREALAQVPRMSRQRFAAVCQALHLVSSHLSGLAVRNFRQEQLIGALRKAQADLKDRDRNLAAIIDFLPDPTLVLDKSGAVIFWNRALEKLTGVSADAMLGKRTSNTAWPFTANPRPFWPITPGVRCRVRMRATLWRKGAKIPSSPKWTCRFSREPQAHLGQGRSLARRIRRITGPSNPSAMSRSGIGPPRLCGPARQCFDALSRPPMRGLGLRCRLLHEFRQPAHG